MTAPKPFKTTQPLVLLSDSQLLFLKEDNQPFIQRLYQLFPHKSALCAAYIGAANGDKPEYFEIFEAAMQSIDITDCRHIKADANQDELAYLDYADLILLAGGDTYLGWQTVSKLKPQLDSARARGAVLIGLSAGAIHLGSLGFHNKRHLSNTDMFATLGYCPAIISAHEEKMRWPMLKQLVKHTDGCLPGFGIPFGAGVLVTADNRLQALHKPMIHMHVQDNAIKEQALWQFTLKV